MTTIALRARPSVAGRGGEPATTSSRSAVVPVLPAPVCLGARDARRVSGRRVLARASSAAPVERAVTYTIDEEGEYWDWRWGSRIHFVRRGDRGVPLLLVPGFGVGWFHFSRQVEALSATHRVFALDILGQGRSWPAEYGSEGAVDDGERLRYSADTWVRMLRDFVLHVVGEPVVLVGNSLGGFLATHLASAHPEVCRGLVLLNATPFWGFLPPEKAKTDAEAEADAAPRASWLWDGAVPAPGPLKAVIQRLWWDQLRRPETVSAMLRLVYVDASAAACPVLTAGILRPTLHPAALDAFASIAFSPRPSRPFHEALASVTAPALLLYGRDDPWVVPLWGQRASRALRGQSRAFEYWEIAPAGHCPHHEAPDVVNAVVAGWVGRAVEGGDPAASSSGAEMALAPRLAVGESWALPGGGPCVTRVDGSPRNVFEWADYWRWRITGVVGG